MDLCPSVGVRSKLGRTKERATKTPESISWPTLAHCLLGATAAPSTANARAAEKRAAAAVAEEKRAIDEITKRFAREKAKAETDARAAEEEAKAEAAAKAAEKRSAAEAVAKATEEQECWDELGEILLACARPDWPRELCTSDPDSVEGRRALARKTFVAALAEWVNMHDLHAPFPMGPPGKDQPCATVENEHSGQERCSCNKLYPRKCIAPGQEEINEDPRRRDLYRVWMARNCHFINNFVPPLLLATLSNMDFQATLTKDAVIEYMTKYMTKSGQGSLIKVMENSFSLCIEKAREQMQGAGSAMLRWFNLQSLTEVKSQLETMHLIAGVPRYFSSREFKDLWLKSKLRQLKSREEIEKSENKEVSLASRSSADVYICRFEWELPSQFALLDLHPASKRPLWIEILTAAGRTPADIYSLRINQETVQASWQEFLQLMSRWQFKR